MIGISNNALELESTNAMIHFQLGFFILNARKEFVSIQ